MTACTQRKPSHIITLTFGSKSDDRLLEVKRFINALGKHYKQHLFVEMSSGIQYERKIAHFETKYHYHMPIAFEYPEHINMNEIQFEFELVAMKKDMSVVIHIEKYISAPNEVGYFLVGHENYDGLWCGCPRGNKCRKKHGCRFRNNMDSWSIDRYTWTP